MQSHKAIYAIQSARGHLLEAIRIVTFHKRHNGHDSHDGHKGLQLSQTLQRLHRRKGHDDNKFHQGHGGNNRATTARGRTTNTGATIDTKADDTDTGIQNNYKGYGNIGNCELPATQGFR